MPCSKETLVLLFYNLSTFLFLLLLFLYFSSTLLLKLLNFIGSYPIVQRNQNGYEYVFSDEDEEEIEDDDEEEEEDNCTYYYAEPVEKDHHLVADIVGGGESLVFLSNKSINNYNNQDLYYFGQEVVNQVEAVDDNFASDEQLSVCSRVSDNINDDDDDAHMVEEEEGVEDQAMTTDADSSYDSVPNQCGPASPITPRLRKSSLMVDGDQQNYGESYVYGENKEVVDTNLSQGENCFIFGPTQLEPRNSRVQEKDDDNEEIFGDSYTVGSTSKSSSEWRSSIKDSTTEDPFSSSSRRSCQKWESYTVFQKYDEEMMFLDRISAQKLHETESLRSIQVRPRSISDRIVHKFSTVNKKSADIRRNPYHELEAAYVAQICLTWEALNWNYKNFQRKRAAHRDFDHGCPANIAQQFQQFQVLLQRYIENEPYEQGRRPQVYARMRLLAPKLLLVPEYRDFEDDQKDEGFGSRITSAAFLIIIEDGIKTFMSFLNADKEKPSQILMAFLRRNQRGSVDPALLHLMKKVNKKKKMKLKDLRRAGKCIRRKKLKVEEEMEILMGLIDLKVVSRVLRMSDLSEEQLHWCEEKMSKVRVLDGKLQRDSSTLFFPAH